MDIPHIEFSDWTPDLEVGLPSIDDQHRRLFELAASFEGDGDQIRVMKSLAILGDYIRTHLREEEELMLACGYPGLEAHRKAHGEFRRMLRELLDNARTMNLDDIAERVRYLVNGWFSQHIRGTDMEYVPAVKDWQAGIR